MDLVLGSRCLEREGVWVRICDPMDPCGPFICYGFEASTVQVFCLYGRMFILDNLLLLYTPRRKRSE